MPTCAPWQRIGYRDGGGRMKLAETRRSFVTRFAAIASAIPIVSFAKQAPRVRRIGLAFGDDPEGGVAAFKEALRQRGYVEGRNLVIEARDSRAAPGTNAAADLA